MGVGEDFTVSTGKNTIVDKVGIGYVHILPGKAWKYCQADLDLIPYDKINYLRLKTKKGIEADINTLFITSIKNTDTSVSDVIVLYETLLNIRRKNNFLLVCTMESDVPKHDSILFYKLQSCGDWKNWLYNLLPQWVTLLDQFQFTPSNQ